jgi:hypothetical protein
MLRNERLMVVVSAVILSLSTALYLFAELSR